MLMQIDLEKVIAANPKVDVEELKKSQEILQDLYRLGVVERSTYELDTPESKGELRYTVAARTSTGFRRLG